MGYDEPIDIDDAELGRDQRLNTPPGFSLEDQHTVIKKGMVLAYYRPDVDHWLVKKVMKAGLPRRRTFRDEAGKVDQSGIAIVRWNAIPIEGKKGTVSSHYKSGPGDYYAGFREVNSATLANTRDRHEGVYWLVDMNDFRAQGWIDAQEALRVERIEEERIAAERVKNTPAAFRARMEARAVEMERLAMQSETRALQYREVAQALRNETPGVIS